MTPTKKPIPSLSLSLSPPLPVLPPELHYDILDLIIHQCLAALLANPADDPARLQLYPIHPLLRTARPWLHYLYAHPTFRCVRAHLHARRLLRTLTPGADLTFLHPRLTVSLTTAHIPHHRHPFTRDALPRKWGRLDIYVAPRWRHSYMEGDPAFTPIVPPENTAELVRFVTDVRAVAAAMDAAVLLRHVSTDLTEEQAERLVKELEFEYTYDRNHKKMLLWKPKSLGGIAAKKLTWWAL